MAMRSGALYDAFKKVGADDETARGAGEELAGMEKQLSSVEGKLSTVQWIATTGVGLQIATILLIASYALNHMAK